MKTDMRRQAALGAIIKDNASDWKNIANREIETNKTLQDKIESLEHVLKQQEGHHIIEIDPKACRNWKYADRNAFELGNIKELAQDIQQNGQLQPIIVRKIDSPNHAYEIIAGERRWRACLLANILIQATVTIEDDAGCLIIQTSENKKKSLSPYSLAVAYQKLMTDLKISQNELSRRLNIPKTSFSELLSFNKVPGSLWSAVEDMSKVKPRTAAFLSLMCNKGKEYVEVLVGLAPKIREGYGAERLAVLIEKQMLGKTNKNAPLIYETDKGDILFRVTDKGRIALSKWSLQKISVAQVAQHLKKYLEETME